MPLDLLEPRRRRPVRERPFRAGRSVRTLVRLNSGIVYHIPVRQDLILINAGKAHVALQKVSGLLSGVDCLALADGLGKDGIDELCGILRFMKSQIEDAEATVGKASDLL